jgi:hypothetical protein
MQKSKVPPGGDTRPYGLDSAALSLGNVTTLAFRISQRNKDHGNYLLGFHWVWIKNWSVMAEAGFGGSRENFFAGATYRF